MEHPFVPLDFVERPESELRVRSSDLYREMNRRRTVRHFSDRPVPREVVENAVRCAGTAPSGAHKQPWHFVLVGDPALKREIRDAAEAEERKNYAGRMPRDWQEDLAPLGTDSNKPFLTTCPWLILVFAQPYAVAPDTGQRLKHYYVQESVGIAVGMLIAALHRIGLASLTHTPSPMGFLREIARRPENERAYMLIATGYPAPGCEVPDLSRKPLDEILTVR